MELGDGPLTGERGVYFECDTCSKPYPDFESASACEGRHTQQATRERLVAEGLHFADEPTRNMKPSLTPRTGQRSGGRLNLNLARHRGAN